MPVSDGSRPRSTERLITSRRRRASAITSALVRPRSAASYSSATRPSDSRRCRAKATISPALAKSGSPRSTKNTGSAAQTRRTPPSEARWLRVSCDKGSRRRTQTSEASSRFWRPAVPIAAPSSVRSSITWAAAPRSDSTAAS